MKVNDIIDGISIKLNSLFGDSVNIYTENIKQGFEEPCFFIKFISSNDENLLQNRYIRRFNFDIHFFTNTNEERLNIADVLINELEFLPLQNGDVLRGVNMKWEIQEDILHFFINYDPIIFKVSTTETEKMEEVMVDCQIKQ